MIMIVSVLSGFRQYSEYSASYQPEVAMANLLYKSQVQIKKITLAITQRLMPTIPASFAAIYITLNPS